MKPSEQKICVLGMWHLGTVTSACLADLGYTVVGYDEREDTVKSLQKGKAIIDEPALDELIRKNIKKKKLSFSSSLKESIKDCKIVILAIDTPLDEEDNVDLTQVLRISQEIAKEAKNDILLIVQSQVPVGTCHQIHKILKENNSLNFEIAYVPENLRLGNAITIFNNPDRIVVGADDPTTLKKVNDFFSIIKAPFVNMDLKSAEMSKHAINAFLANCISFVNELGNLCEEVGADSEMVSKSLTTESRIGSKLPLKPGLGFAGGTLARDLKIIKTLQKKHKLSGFMVNAILQTNYEQNIIALNKLKKLFGDLNGLRVGILGLTYKPGTNTLRRSSSIEIISKLLEGGAFVKAFDPAIHSLELFEGKKFILVNKSNEVAKDSDVVLLMTDWPEFKNIIFKEFYDLMKKKVFLDMKNMFDPKNMRELGFTYVGVGKK